MWLSCCVNFYNLGHFGSVINIIRWNGQMKGNWECHVAFFSKVVKKGELLPGGQLIWNKLHPKLVYFHICPNHLSQCHKFMSGKLGKRTFHVTFYSNYYYVNIAQLFQRVRKILSVSICVIMSIVETCIFITKWAVFDLWNKEKRNLDKSRYVSPLVIM